MREKLIELLLSVPTSEVILGNRSGKRYATAWHIADHLIANGVTVQQWIPVTERLPREEWEYFTEENDWDVYPCLAVVKNSRGGRHVTKMFYTGENFVDDEYVRYTAQVTHWMPLPEPPKGE